MTCSQNEQRNCHMPFIFSPVELVTLFTQTTVMNKSSKQMIPFFVVVLKLSSHLSVKFEVFFCALSPLTSAMLFPHLEPQTSFLHYSLCPDH